MCRLTFHWLTFSPAAAATHFVLRDQCSHYDRAMCAGCSGTSPDVDQPRCMPHCFVARFVFWYSTLLAFMQYSEACVSAFVCIYVYVCVYLWHAFLLNKYMYKKLVEEATVDACVWVLVCSWAFRRWCWVARLCIFEHFIIKDLKSALTSFNFLFKWCEYGEKQNNLKQKVMFENAANVEIQQN